MSKGLDLTSLGLMLLMALAVASLVGALLFLYRWLVRRRLFPQLPRIWGVDRKRFIFFAGLFALLCLVWVGLAYLAQPTPEPPAPTAEKTVNPGPDPAQPPPPAVQPGEPGYFPLPHRSVQTAGEERALPPGPERSLPGSEGGQSTQPATTDQSGLPGGAGDSPSWATVTSLTTTSSTTTLTVPTTVKEPDATPAGQPPASAPPAPVSMAAPSAPAATPPAPPGPPAATASAAAPPAAASPAPSPTVSAGSPPPVAPTVTNAPPAAGQASLPTTTTPPAPAPPPVNPPVNPPAPPASSAKAAPNQAAAPPPAPAKAAPPKAEKPAAPAGPARYAACLGSHKTQAQAEVQKARLTRAGVMAEVWAVDLPGKGRWHRVCAGDFATLAEAQAQAKAWEKEGLATTPFPVRRP